MNVQAGLHVKMEYAKKLFRNVKMNVMLIQVDNVQEVMAIGFVEIMILMNVWSGELKIVVLPEQYVKKEFVKKNNTFVIFFKLHSLQTLHLEASQYIYLVIVYYYGSIKT